MSKFLNWCFSPVFWLILIAINIGTDYFTTGISGTTTIMACVFLMFYFLERIAAACEAIVEKLNK